LLQPLTPITTKDPQEINLNFVLGYTNLAPDGYTRKVWTVNGQYPGPLIHCNRGDRLVINVTNGLEDPATIHWHGIFQLGSNWYDGVGGQTQCPILPGVSFVYNFTVADQVGTYWWHSHYLSQYVDGVRGPLIINDPDDPYLSQYDYEYVLTLEDWYHTQSSDLVAMRLAPADSGLISGRGQYNCSRALSGSQCDPNNMPAIYTVTKGKRYRFRIINMSAESFFWFSIDQHVLQVIEVDGVSIKPINITVLPIHIGERFSVIVEASQDVDNYWIRANIPDDCIETDPDTINHDSDLINNNNITGILRYDGAPNDTIPKSKMTNDDWSNNLYPCQDLAVDLIKPYVAVEPPQKVTDPINIAISIGYNSRNTTTAYINGQSWVPDITNPSIMKIMAENESVTSFPINANAYAYDTENGTVELVLRNLNGTDHPFHLHGHNFFIMAISSSGKPDTKLYNLVDPPLRDTITIPSGGWAVIRFMINNPGVWAFHCHIEWHVELGMVFQLIEQQSKIKQLTLPDSVAALCKPGYQNTKRLAFPSPDGEETTTTTPGGYVIHQKPSNSSKVKRNTKRDVAFNTKRNARIGRKMKRSVI
ncbi:5052_t:CDS:10, partial [Dentiscutata heterogama]